jgi:hypothetical protein
MRVCAMGMRHGGTCPTGCRRLKRLLAALLAAGPILGAAAAVGFDRIEPPGGTRGTEMELRLTGSDLADPREVFFEEGRIEVLSLEADGSGVKAKIRIAEDCPLGPRRVRVRTASGLSELRLFQVHRWPQQQEKEPNDLPEKAMPIDPLAGTRTLWGALRGEDVDSFRLTLPAGARLSAVVEAVRLDQQMLDTHLELVDAAGFVVAACDDHPLLSQDPALTVTVEKAGDYVLRIRESAYAGNGVYMLHVGTFPVPTTAYPPGGVAGEEIDVEWMGDPAGSFRERIRLPESGLDRLGRVCPSRDGAESAVCVPLRVTDRPPVLESEPNDEPTQPDDLSGPGAVCGRMDASEDVDWVRVKAEKGSKWRITGWGRRVGSPIDLVVAAHRDDDKRQQITSSDDAGGPDSLLTVTTPAEGSFLLRVSDFQRRGGPEYAWWLDVEPVVEQVNVSVPPATTRTQQRLVAAVPRGNRTALVFNASREGCNEPVSIGFEGLPDGVTTIESPFDPAAPGGLVVFEAAADAAPGVALAGVAVNRGEGDSAKRMGGLLQGTDTVMGEPNRTTYRTVFGNRLPVAVVEEVPVSIELLEPAGPIVKRGSAELVVKVNRPADYDGRIRLELPFKPPGIGGRSVDVKKGETEVRLPISCAANAAVKDWQIAVAATLSEVDSRDKKSARRGGGGIWISSRPVTLTIAEPFVDLAAEKASAEQGTTVKLVFKVNGTPSFQGVARAKLLGLPAKAEAAEVEFRPEQETLEFEVKVGRDTPVGKHQTVICQLEVPVGDAMVTHQAPPTTLRVDRPLSKEVARSN